MNTHKVFLALLLTVATLILPSPVFGADTVDKTICKLAVGYQDVDEIQADLLAAAKREVINELFGEMIVASTAVENFVVTSDQIRTSSIGFVRVDGNAEFFNGKGFAEVCVTIQAYITDEDRAKFNPERLENKYCDADDNLTTPELIAYVKDEAIIQELTEYNPKLKGIDRDSLLQLVQKVTYLESGFLADAPTTYCVKFEGYVVPVEIIAFLEEEPSRIASANTSEGSPSTDETPVPTIESTVEETLLPHTIEVNKTTSHYKYNELSFTLKSIEIREDGSMRWNLLVVNDSKQDYAFGFNFDESYVGDNFGELYSINEASVQSNELIYHRVGLSYAYWFEFSAPQTVATKLTLTLQDRQFGGPHPSFSVILPESLALPNNEISKALPNSTEIKINKQVKHPKYDGVDMTLTTIDVALGTAIRWHFLICNNGNRDHAFGFNFDESSMRDENGQGYTVVDASITSNELVYHRFGLCYAYWFDFSAPQNGAKNLSLSLQDRQFGGPHPSFSIQLP
ncbi:MAG: hypothetical protein ACOYNY_30130 [Caldilineaceae bacterium]